MSVTCREDVPSFEPELIEPAVFSKNDYFRDWLYCKLMNAEWACYKSEQFAKLQYRTRCVSFYLVKIINYNVLNYIEILFDFYSTIDITQVIEFILISFSAIFNISS